MEQECLTITLTFIIAVALSALAWMPRVAVLSAIADTIARLRKLWLNFGFIICLLY